MTGRHADIVIVGAGMVGATLACALARLNLDIVLIERQQAVLDWPPQSIDLRVSAITPASEYLFTALDLWGPIYAAGACAYQHMHVWDSSGTGVIDFDASEVGQPHLGHIIENRVIQRAGWQACVARENIELRCPASVTSLQDTEHGKAVQLEDGSEIVATLVIAADGGNSKIRELAGLQSKGWQYGQKGVVTAIQTQHSLRQTAWQVFLPTGPIAFLPLTDKSCSIVWSTSTAHADELVAMADSDFVNALHNAFGGVLGRLELLGPRAAFPLRLAHAPRYVSEHVVLVGDAAHSIHPLAGQGVNLGLADAATLTDVVQQALQQGESPGSQKVLRRYERARKGDNLAMLAAMDGFKRLFGSRNRLLQWLRNTGMGTTDKIVPLKQLLMQHAMGLTGEVPSLSRPPLRRVL